MVVSRNTNRGDILELFTKMRNKLKEKMDTFHVSITCTTIYYSIMFVFDLYGIKNKVLSLTFDNVSSNTTAINLFKYSLKPPHGSQLFH